MKQKVLLCLFLLFFWLSNTTAQTGTPSGSIGDNFVSGISPVTNTITISGLPGGTYYVDFYATDPSYTIAYDSLIDNTGGGPWSWNLDMGSLPPNAVIWAAIYDNTATLIDYTYDYVPTILPTPEWLLNGGYVSNVSVVGNNVQMLGHFAFANQNNAMLSDIPGLGNRPYNMVNPEVVFNIDFDCGNGAAAPQAPDVNLDLNIFNQVTIPYSYNMPDWTSLSFDSNFNLLMVADGVQTSTMFEVNWPLAKFYPLFPVPYPSVKIDGGFKLETEVHGRMVYGHNSNYNAWGIDTALITAKITGSAMLRAKADALIASASGTLIARGSVGGGLMYSDFPSPTMTPLFGMDLEIAGAIDYRLGPSFFTLKEGHLEKTFYQRTWGDQLRTSPFEKQIWDNVDAKGNYTSMVMSNPYLATPDMFAQANMTANDSDLYVVWLDTIANNTVILFSGLDYQSSTFSSPLIVAAEEVISNPKAAILPSGNVLISWTQNRYTSSTFDTTMLDLVDLLQAQDIWVTLYDKPTNSFYTPVMLSDINSGPQTGRAEGNANIIMGKGEYGLITWVVNNDATNENADVWYATVAEISGNVYLGAPQQLINLPGTNRSINIAYYDSTNAIACWINDPDGLDSTLDNEVVYMEWAQTSQTTGTWGSINTLIANDGTMSFDDISADFNGPYGAVSWTTTEYDVNGDFQKGIYVDAWDWQTQDWAPYSYALDYYYYFAQPKVSVNKNGYVALTFQAIQMFDDTTSPDVGELDLYLNDSQNDPVNWFTNNGNPLLGDSSVYVWDLNTVYGDMDNFYIITQESDTITGNAPVNPPYGVRFGNNYLNLVFRALDVSPTVITDIPEPSTYSTITKGNSFDFNLYPNPSSTFATIEYSLNNASDVTIEIYNLSGQLVSTVFQGKQFAGTYKAIYEPNGIPDGIYLCRVIVNDQAAVKKMVIAR